MQDPIESMILDTTARAASAVRAFDDFTAHAVKSGAGQVEVIRAIGRLAPVVGAAKALEMLQPVEDVLAALERMQATLANVTAEIRATLGGSRE